MRKFKVTVTSLHGEFLDAVEIEVDDDCDTIAIVPDGLIMNCDGPHAQKPVGFLDIGLEAW